MADMVPSGPHRPGRLTEVLTGALDAVRGRRGIFGDGLTRVLVVLVDGLGADQLAERAGHARTLAPLLDRASRVPSGFPTTTAAAIASLVTGLPAGQHGIVGYTALDPRTGRVVNQLHGFDDPAEGPGGERLPDDWLRGRTVFQQAVDDGVAAFAVGPRHHAGSGFTRVMLRGADYLGERTVEQRLTTAIAALRASPRAIGYCYIPELDQAAHHSGWRSAEWTRWLETVDDAVRRLALRRGELVVVTADHGMVDVPESRRLLVDGVPGLRDGVRFFAGEPRLRQLYLEADADAESVRDRWRDAFGDVAEVVTRAEAIGADWFGPTDPAVAPRIGDVLVAARREVAFFADDPGRMVGQHGSWSAAERIVPLIRLRG